MGLFSRPNLEQRALAVQLNDVLEKSVGEANAFKRSIAPLYSELGDLLRAELALPDTESLEWAGSADQIAQARDALDTFVNQLYDRRHYWIETGLGAAYRANVSAKFLKDSDRIIEFWFRKQALRLEFVRTALNPVDLLRRDDVDRANVVWSGLNMAWDEARIGMVRLR